MDHTNLRDLVEFMAKALVDLPDEVEVNEIQGEQTTVVELKVAKTDLGKVIGKKGKTAHSMRTILNAASTKLKKRSVLEIVE
ncbi:MAG: KH domain-containing protein [Pseudomonadota bacterium]|nr:KH domain-containing protein [Pseudomonadota bacterium]